MEKTIWKFELETTDNQHLELPIGAEILTVQTQSEKPCIWVLVDPKAEKETRRFQIYGTGHPIYIDGVSRSYVGTYQLQNGSLVFHLFESKTTSDPPEH